MYHLHVLGSCLMVDKDRNENRHVFSSQGAFSRTFFTFYMQNSSVSVFVCVSVLVVSVEGVGGSDTRS